MYKKIRESYVKKFVLKFAKTPKERAKGLMYVKEIIGYDGMIFVFDKEDYHSVWMKNTYVVLDVLFLDSNFNIVDIYIQTTPLSVESIRSKVKCKYIVELKEGSVNEHDLIKGSKLSFDIIKN